MKRIVFALGLMALLVLALTPAALAANQGAGKAPLYNTESGYTCALGATDTSGATFGFAVMNVNGNGTLGVEVAVKGATPNSTYDIWVNQDPGACPLGAPTAAGVLSTNGQGNGNAHVTLPAVEDATMFWVSAVGGGQVLRSTAVALK